MPVKKLDMGDVVQGLIVGMLMAVLAAGVSTYVEVKMLRHDLDRVEGIIDNLVDK